MSGQDGGARRAFRHFAIEGELLGAERLGSGHIHETFVARARRGGGEARFVLQRLNGAVFPDIPALMGNLRRVTEHQRSALAREGARDAERRCLQPIATRDGKGWHADEEGECWRAFHFLEGAHSRDVVERASQAREAARAFGAFAAQLADLGPPRLAETIARFHDLPWRVLQLQDALGRDPRHRARGVEREAGVALRAADWIAGELAAGGFASLPRRVVHNDCKINNVMFDVASDEALCVIDLDTVMEGTLLCDFGELIRTSVSRAPEDAVDLDAMRVDPFLYAAVAEGYLAGAGALMRADELDLLPLAGPLLSLENGLRFLADHVEGDRYFRVHREGQNLDRARAQLRLHELLRDDLGEARERIRAASPLR